MRFAIIDLLYIAKYGVFLSLFIYVVLILISKRKLYLNKNTLIIFVLFNIWFTVMILGTVNSVSVMETIFTIFSYILLFAFCLVMIPNYVDTNKKLADYMKVFYWSILLCILLSVGLHDSNSFSISPADLRYRYQGFFNNPNRLALFSFVGFLSTIGVHILTNRKLYLLPVPLYIICIYFSDSRTAILALILFSLLYGFFFLKSKKLIFLQLSRIVMFLLIPLVFISVAIIIFNLNSFLFFLDGLLSGRVVLWAENINQLTSSALILFGQGLSQSNVHIDNYYVLILAKTGWLGLLCLLSILLTVFIQMTKKYKVDTNKWDTFIISLFITFLVYSFLESILFTLGNITSLFLWSLIGIYLSKRFKLTSIHKIN